ncbi:hypothetical protein KDA23_02165 [Candidatus Saccharibacteria bacterium]|nr:hypothetical protein [Candidatus Saccharibacteria bacterium]
MSGNITTISEHVEAGSCPYANSEASGLATDTLEQLLASEPLQLPPEDVAETPKTIGELPCKHIYNGVCALAVEGIARACQLKASTEPTSQER